MFSALKILPYLIPFLKEMILGKKTWREGFRDNKKKTFFVLIVIMSFGLNIILVPRLTGLATKHILLAREYADYRAAYPAAATSTQKHPMANGAEVTAGIKPPTPFIEANLSNEIEFEFKQIRDRESVEH